MIKKTKFYIIFTFATLLYLAFLGAIGSLGYEYLQKKTSQYSELMLTQSQKEESKERKILFAEMSDFLKSSDEAKFQIFINSNEIGNKSLAKKYLSKMRDYSVLDRIKGDKYLSYLWLYQQGYPHEANKYITQGNSKEGMTRDQYLILSRAFYEQNMYQQTYENLLKAREKDIYYPQTYQQLIEVCKKLNRTAEAEEYTKFLSQITW